MALRLQTGKDLNLVVLDKQKRTTIPHVAGILPTGFHEYPSIVHSSMVKDFGKCARHVLYRDKWGLTRPGARVSALDIGRYFHEVVALKTQGFTSEKMFATVRKRFNTEIAQLSALADQMGTLPNGSQLEREIEDRAADFHKALAMGVIFCQKFPPDLNKYEVVGSEIPVVVKIVPPTKRKGGSTFPAFASPIKGTLDLVLRDRKTGVLWIRDYKTTSKPPLQIADALGWDLQPVVYRLLAMAAFPNAKIVGFDHTIMKKPTIQLSSEDRDYREYDHTLKSGPRKGEVEKRREYSGEPKVENYIKRMSEWYDDLGGDWNHADVPMVHHEHRFEASLPDRDLLVTLKNAEACLKQTVSTESWDIDFPRCGSYMTCGGWIGQSPCDYMNLCDCGGNVALLRNEIERCFVQEHRDFNEKGEFVHESN